MSNAHWASYWQSGVPDSFGGRVPRWYAQVLLPFWQQHLDDLAANSSVLDLASGNGAIAALVAAVSQKKALNLDICATDKAPLAPRHLDQVRLFPNQPLETLDLGEQRFDLAVSQFGLEYAALEPALKAVARHLKPGGRLIAVMHRQDSAICSRSREELQQYRALKKEHPLLDNLRQLVKAMGEVRTRADHQRLSSNPASERQRLQFNRTLEKLMRQFPQGVVLAGLLQAIQPILKNITWPQRNKLQAINAIGQQMELAELRLLDLLNAALDDKRLNHLLVHAERLGFSVASNAPLVDSNGNLLAQTLILQFSPGAESK